MARKTILSERTIEVLGLKEKDLHVYEVLLGLGTAPLRRVAEEAGLNRGTTHDTLKRLLSLGLVSYVDAKKHRYFMSEDPDRLRGLCTRREVAIEEAREEVLKALPGFQELSRAAHHRPSVRYFEGDSGVKDVLEDVLATTERPESRLYRIYSSSALRDRIAKAWPTFTRERIRRGVRVQAIAVGEGGAVAELAERKWIPSSASAPTYIFIYGAKTAYVSVDRKENLFAVLIDDAAIAATQTLIFDRLWDMLPS